LDVLTQTVSILEERLTMVEQAVDKKSDQKEVRDHFKFHTYLIPKLNGGLRMA
jgi:hypothetical protein